jgi:hypothetical protein
LTLSEEILELSEKKKELEDAIKRMDYHQPIFFKQSPIPVPEASKVQAKQELILAERGEIITDFGMPEVRIFRLKDKDHLPKDVETEIPDKILIEGNEVVYVFRVRSWLRRIR